MADSIRSGSRGRRMPAGRPSTSHARGRHQQSFSAMRLETLQACKDYVVTGYGRKYGVRACWPQLLYPPPPSACRFQNCPVDWEGLARRPVVRLSHGSRHGSLRFRHCAQES
eukprot:3792104-Pleurochrysis_carterae.AAC.4